MSDYINEIKQLFRTARGESDGDVAMLEEAARIADVHADVRLGLEARIKLMNAANWAGNHELVLVAFTWCLAQLDRDEPVRLRFERRVLWYYKWVVQSLCEYAQVSRRQIAWSFDDMSNRYHRAGFGDGAIYKCKAYTSIRLGDQNAFEEARARWMRSPRDDVSDCEACQTDTAVEFDLYAGDLEGAIRTAEPIIQGRQRCTEVPCITFGRLLLPLLKLRNPDLADHLHRTTIRQALSSRDFLPIAGDHCAYLALAGKIVRSVQVFETGMPWLMIARRTWDRMRFAENAAVLFERLAAEGDRPIPLRIPKTAPFHRDDARYTPSIVASELERMRAGFAAEFNQRNGNNDMDRRHRAFRDLVAAIPPAAAANLPDAQTTRLPPALRVILIGGTSHAGKSSLGRHLADSLGWEYQSTDTLARHPGRPWSTPERPVPPHVAEHYATLPVDELVGDVLRHYEKNVLPQVRTLVSDRLSDSSAPGLVLEGSALWPRFVAPLLSDQVAGLWLTAGDQLLTQRIQAESDYARRTASEQRLIDKFIERTIAFSALLDMALGDGERSRVDITESDPIESVARSCLRALSDQRGGDSRAAAKNCEIP